MDGTTNRATRWGMGVLDFLLIAAALLVFVLWVAVPFLGPAGLGVLNGSICEPTICGQFMSVTADLVSGPWFRELPTTNTTYDFGGQMTVNVLAYDNWRHGPIALLLSGVLLKGLVAFGVLVAMLVILRSLRVGDPFTRRNAHIVMLIAILVGIGGQLSVLLSAWGKHDVLNQPGIVGYMYNDFSMSLLPLACGLVIAVFAETFRRGAMMREDVEGLV